MMDLDLSSLSPEALVRLIIDHNPGPDYSGLDRWPAAEPIIMTSPLAAYDYAFAVVKGRWPEAEPTIMKNPQVAYLYAANVVRGQWPEAEPTLSSHTEHAFAYAKMVIKGRWPEAEGLIAADPWFAYNYARDVIKGRWPEAEESIVKVDPRLVKAYFSAYPGAKKMALAMGWIKPVEL